MSQNNVTADEQARFDQFLFDLKEQGRTPRTLTAYQQDWQLFASWFHQTNGEAFVLDRLSAMDMQDYLTWGKTQNLKPSTLNRRIGLLKQYVKWAEEQGLVPAEQQKRIKKVRLVKRQPLAPQSLTSKEVRKLLKEVELRGSLRDQAIIKTLLFTGLRVGELAALTREDVILSERHGTLLIRAEHAKGGKERQVPLPKEARAALKAYMEIVSDGQRLFMGRQGALSEAGVAAMLRKYAAWADLEEISPHVLRHTFAYNYLEKNHNDLVGLADILGHEDLNTTYIYTKRRLSDLQNDIENVQFF